jgi:hypothetical protein
MPEGLASVLQHAGLAAAYRHRPQPSAIVSSTPLMTSQSPSIEPVTGGGGPGLDASTELFDGMAHRAGAETAALRPRPPASDRLAAMLGGRLPGQGDPY